MIDAYCTGASFSSDWVVALTTGSNGLSVVLIGCRVGAGIGILSKSLSKSNLFVGFCFVVGGGGCCSSTLTVVGMVGGCRVCDVGAIALPYATFPYAYGT